MMLRIDLFNSAKYPSFMKKEEKKQEDTTSLVVYAQANPNASAVKLGAPVVDNSKSVHFLKDFYNIRPGELFMHDGKLWLRIIAHNSTRPTNGTTYGGTDWRNALSISDMINFVASVSDDVESVETLRNIVSNTYELRKKEIELGGKMTVLYNLPITHTPGIHLYEKNPYTVYGHVVDGVNMEALTSEFGEEAVSFLIELLMLLPDSIIKQPHNRV